MTVFTCSRHGSNMLEESRPPCNLWHSLESPRGFFFCMNTTQSPFDITSRIMFIGDAVSLGSFARQMWRFISNWLYLMSGFYDFEVMKFTIRVYISNTIFLFFCIVIYWIIVTRRFIHLWTWKHGDNFFFNIQNFES